MDKYIRKNGNSWQVRYRGVVKSFPTRKLAREYRDKLISSSQDAPQSTEHISRSVSLCDYIEANMGILERSVQSNTFIGYRSKLRCYVLPSPLGKLNIQFISSRNVQDFIDSVRGSEGQQLSPKTIIDIHGVLSWFFKRAMKEGIIENNPCKCVSLPERIPVQRKVMTPSHASDCLRWAREEHSPDYVSYCVLFCTGMRKSEVLAITWSDLDLEKNVISVNNKIELSKDRVPTISSTLKSKTSRRKIVINIELSNMLITHREEQEKCAKERGELWKNVHDLVFPDAFGGIQHPDAYEGRFRRMQERHGQEVVGFHGFRHHLATELVLAGVDITAVAVILGHTDPNFTRKQYQDVYESQLEEAAEIAGKLMPHG